MKQETHKVPAESCPTPEVVRAPSRAWQGSYDSPAEGPSLAGGTTLRRNVGTDYDKSGEAERELPPYPEANPAVERFGGM